jgi:hypothetical protein
LKPTANPDPHTLDATQALLDEYREFAGITESNWYSGDGFKSAHFAVVVASGPTAAFHRGTLTPVEHVASKVTSEGSAGAVEVLVCVVPALTRHLACAGDDVGYMTESKYSAFAEFVVLFTSVFRSPSSGHGGLQ